MELGVVKSAIRDLQETYICLMNLALCHCAIGEEQTRFEDFVLLSIENPEEYRSQYFG